jgi:hypothetical protein
MKITRCNEDHDLLALRDRKGSEEWPNRGPVSDFGGGFGTSVMVCNASVE